MRDNSDTAGIAIILVVGTLAVAPISIMWSGYVISVLWGWFIVPTFSAAPLGIAAAIGLRTVVSMLTMSSWREPRDKDDAGKKLVTALCTAVLAPATILLVGFLVKQFL